MDDVSIALVGGAAVVSLAHGLLPNHWLPFVLIGRAQGWPTRRVLAVLLAAGAAHVAVSGAIAMVLMLVGVAVRVSVTGFAERLGGFLPGVVLLGAGILYVALDLWHRRGHAYHHHHHHDLHEAAASGMSDRGAVATLVLTLALSPCEAMLPIFVSAAPKGDPTLLFVLVVASGAASILVMSTLAWLALRGVGRLNFGPFADRERLLVGLVLVVVGAVTLGLAL